ncbi:MAG: hypothetical protein ACJA0Q_000980 [Saprospiraceae bacterium]|jgi:hypothetical protein
MKKVIVGMLVMMLMVACSSTKEVANNSNSITEETVTKTNEVKKVELLTFKRTSCFGRCPVYDLKIYSDKTCEVDGKLFFIVEGIHQGALTQSQYDDVLKRIKDINYFELKDVYDDPFVQDIPASYVSVQLDGKAKSIKSRYNSPKELTIFLTYLHELTIGMVWSK